MQERKRVLRRRLSQKGVRKPAKTQRSFDVAKFATLGWWVDRFTRVCLSRIEYLPPLEYERAPARSSRHHGTSSTRRAPGARDQVLAPKRPWTLLASTG